MNDLERYSLHKEEVINGLDGLARYITQVQSEGITDPTDLATSICDVWLPPILETAFGSGYDDGSSDGYEAGLEDGLFNSEVE